MYNYNEFIFERYVNVIDDDKKIEYIDIVWDILTNAYKSIGGFKSVKDKNELLHTSGIWKLVRHSGKIVACALYKDQFGRKCYGIASDGTITGKNAIMKIINEDIKLGRSWSETSGSIEFIMKKRNSLPIPVDVAEIIINKMGKEIISKNNDGFHYTRMINGEPIEKIMFGTVIL